MANIALDGSTPFSAFGNNFTWDNNFIGRVNIRAADGQPNYTLNAALTGNWEIGELAFRSDAPLTANFTDSGSGNRRIEYLNLGDSGDFTATLDFSNTRVRFVRGDGDVDLTLGSERTSAIELYGTSRITLGSGNVTSIELGNVNDTVNGGDGYLGAVNLGHGSNVFDGGNGFVSYLNGGDGDDTVTIRGGADSLSLNRGNNSVTVAAAPNENYVGAITSYSGNNTVAINQNGAVRSIGFSDGRDSVTLDRGRSEQIQLGGNDDSLVLLNGSRVDSALLGDGNNSVTMGGGSSIGQLSGYGTDTVSLFNGSQIDSAHLSGGSGSTVTLTGDSRIGSLQLGNGADTVTLNDDSRIFQLKMGGGANSLTTGDGFMESVYSYQGSNTLRIGAGGAGQIYFSGDGRAQTHDIVAQGYIGSLQIRDNASSTVALNGGAGLVSLGNGNDTVTMGNHRLGLVELGDGDDTIFLNETNPNHGTSVQGGSGFDTANFSQFDMGVSVSLQLAGAFQDVGDFSGDTSQPVAGFFSFIQMESLVGSAFNDRLIGSDDSPTGTLLGNDGNDTIYGGAGDDLIGGGNGNDLLYGGAGTNTIYGGAGNDTVHGGSGNDAIIGGGNGANRLLGNGGDDVITAGSGNDFLAGGDGNDTIYGGAGANTIYLGTGDDLVGGGQGDDIIFAGAGNNRIYGGTGNDTIVAGTGRDVTTAGPGADVFVFNSAAQAGIGAGRDVITDFEAGIDRIDLSALNMTFVGNAAFSGTAGELRYISGFVVGDLDGDGVNDFAIELSGAPALTAGDFIL